MNVGFLVVLVVLVLGSFVLSRRAKARVAAKESLAREGIRFGTEVMTTSGLYGTVVGLNDDDTVQLAVAPGVELKWAMAALRDAASLPERYRAPISGPTAQDTPHSPTGTSATDSTADSSKAAEPGGESIERDS